MLTVNHLYVSLRHRRHPSLMPTLLTCEHTISYAKINTIDNQFIYKSIINVDLVKVLPKLNHPILQPPVLL